MPESCEHENYGLPKDQQLRVNALYAALSTSNGLPAPFVPNGAINKPDTQEEADTRVAQVRAVEAAEAERVLRLAQRYEGYIRDGQTFTDADLTALATEQ